VEEAEGDEEQINNEEEVEPIEEEDQVAKLQAELEESKDKYLRLYSEFENFRRRNAKERLELIKNANEELILRLLPVMDDFERGKKAIKKDKEQESAVEGFKLVYGNLKNILKQSGLKAMKIKPGSEFDVEFHEAISQIPAPKKSLKGKIVDVIEEGYYLNDKVIRFAKVVIGT
jgi:molecular chaperone GrpE